MEPRAPLNDLAAIVRETNAAACDRARLRTLVDVVDATEIFDAVVAMGSKDDQRFITFDVRGDRERTSGWKSWPLHRLFETMALRRISHPHGDLAALAIPIDYGDERCVVLAVTSDWARDDVMQSFFDALENFAVPRHEQTQVPPDGIPVSPVEPRIACFDLCPALKGAIDGILTRRGWMYTDVENSFRARAAAAAAAAKLDVMFVDLDHLPDPLATLLHLHNYFLAETKIIAFGNEACKTLERQGLVDVLIEHDVGEATIFATLKRFVRQVPAMRKSRLRAMTVGFEVALRDSQTPSQLSVAGARQAASVMSGWASVQLVSPNGAIFASEHPRLHEPVLTALPKTFLSDGPLFQLRADQRFYDEVSDDRSVVGALARLRPVSAASIPLRHGEQSIGTLVSVSRNVAVDSSVFEALDGFAKLVTRRFEDLARAAFENPSMQRNGVWECVHQGTLEFAAYRSRNSALVWDYRPIESDCGLLLAGDALDFPWLRRFRPNGRFVEEQLASFVDESKHHRLFIALCDTVASTVTYAARGFPAPLLFDARGPAGAVSGRGSIVRGTVTIAPPAGLLVWDTPLQRWLVRESVEVKSVTEVLEDLRPQGVAIVITSARA